MSEPPPQGPWRQPVDPGLLDTVRRRVLAEPGPLTELRMAAAVRDSGRLLGAAGSFAAMERISAEFHGLGLLQELLRDAEVTDIFVNGPDSVWLDRGHGPEAVPLHFENEAAVRALATRLVAAGGRRLDDASPCVDVKIEPGYRVHAVLPPVSSTGTLLSIRILRRRAFPLDHWEAGAGGYPTVGAVLRAVVAGRLNFLISGATGAGKTTLLTTLLGLCEPRERLVLIEDAAELAPMHPHVVTLEARHANAEGAGAVELQELLRQALRMNPGRLVVGECRGQEVRELLMALNTGHSGGAGTIHANGAADVPARLLALGALAGMSMAAVALQAASALDVVIHLERGRAGRRVGEIAVLSLLRGRLVAVPALTRVTAPPCPPGSAAGEPDKRLRPHLAPGPAWPALASRLGMPPECSVTGPP